MEKIKITAPGEKCWRCDTPIVLMDRMGVKPKRKSGESYYDKYLACPKCGAVYLDKNEKRLFSDPPPLFAGVKP